MNDLGKNFKFLSNCLLAFLICPCLCLQLSTYQSIHGLLEIIICIQHYLIFFFTYMLFLSPCTYFGNILLWYWRLSSKVLVWPHITTLIYFSTYWFPLEFPLWLSGLRTQHSVREDVGSIPGLTQWVKDRAFPLCCGS